MSRPLCLTLTCMACLLLAGESAARCVASVAYRADFEILACRAEDPKDRSKILGGNGVILDVRVVAKKKINGPETHEWWPANGALPQQMKVFHDTERKPACAALKPGMKTQGTLRSLCCDGGEPRCDYGLSAAVYDIGK